MTGVERRHQWLMAVYSFGAVVAVGVAWFPSFLCRAGGAVLLVGLIHMICQRRSALRKGMVELARLRRSLLHYTPFLVGTNLIWMGLPLPLGAIAKASADLLFLGGSVGLLSVLYIYNNRGLNALSGVALLGTNPHSEEG
jgi:hypothetical protein